MSTRFDLDGRVALVTGASSGLGRHFAATLARAGAEVVLAARRVDACRELADRLTAEGHRAHAVRIDVTEEDGIVAGFDAAERAAGTVDVLINNSGIAITCPAIDMSTEDWDRLQDTNLRGAFLVAREAARRLRAAERPGAIVNIASIMSFRAVPGLSAYAASKAALMHLTRALALELARHRIRVNALAPGYIGTEMNREYFDSPPGQTMVKRIPQRRVGEPADLDGALLLLASDASAYMTGAEIVVDGGHSHAGI